jgi:hypothetical protein
MIVSLLVMPSFCKSQFVQAVEISKTSPITNKLYPTSPAINLITACGNSNSVAFDLVERHINYVYSELIKRINCAYPYYSNGRCIVHRVTRPNGARSVLPRAPLRRHAPGVSVTCDFTHVRATKINKPAIACVALTLLNFTGITVVSKQKTTHNHN